MSRIETRNKLAAVGSMVIEGYKNGMTLRQLGDLHDVSQASIRNLLKKNSVDLRPRGRRKKETA